MELEYTNRIYPISDIKRRFWTRLLEVPVEPVNVQKPTNVQTSTNVQTFYPQMCKRPQTYKHFTHKCANVHKCANISPTNVQICKNSSTTNVQTSYLQMCKRSVFTGNVQIIHWSVLLKFTSSLSFLGRFWFCLFYLIGLVGASKLLHWIVKLINKANLFEINEKCYISSILQRILILFVLSDRAWWGLQNFYTELWNSLSM